MREYPMFRILPLALLAAAGCSGQDPNLPPLVPAAGTVTLGGKPLSGAQVTFTPAGATRGTGAEGRTGKDGRYELSSAHGRGAAAGEYRVTIAKLVMPDGSDYAPGAGVGPADSPAREVLPPRYSDPHRTTLTATVPAAGSGTIDFAL